MIEGFLYGAGFMMGVLIVYTLYDFAFVSIQRKIEKSQAMQRKKRRH